MGKLKSEREKRLQKKLIPVNIIVCIISLVAAISLFLLPILKIDVGGMVRDSGIAGIVEEKIDEVVDKQISESGNDEIDYKPVVGVIIKDVLGNIEGEISVSAFSGFKVLTGSGDKVKIVMDELLLGENALATRLIDSIANAVANIFKTKEGKELLEDTVVYTLTKTIIDSVDSETVSNALTNQNVKELVGIMKGLEDVKDGDVTEVANKFVDKINDMLGADASIDDENKQVVIDKVQEIYDDTKSHLEADGKVTMEAIICVALSENINLDDINIKNLFEGLLGNKGSEGSANVKTVDEELSGGGEEGGETNPEPPTAGGDTPAEGNKIVTNYDDFLIAIGFDDDGRAEFKESLRKVLNEKLDGIIKDNGVDGYMGYYQYTFFSMLAFIGPWIILFLFSFFHLFAKNKRFTMWYVKLICWLPSFIWVALKLVPWLATKFKPDMWEGQTGTIVKGVLSSISSFTWVNGLCYILLWIVSIFWAFPIKRKIRKERKNPEVVDAEDDDGYSDDYDSFDD